MNRLLVFVFVGMFGVAGWAGPRLAVGQEVYDFGEAVGM